MFFFALCPYHPLCGRRLKVVMRTRRFYDIGALMRLYKAFVLPYAERGIPAIYHAHPTTLVILDRVQGHFLEQCGISPEIALTSFNLAPLNARRDMAMLGLLHRVQLGTAPKPLADFFPPARSSLYDFAPNISPPHNRQFQCNIAPRSSAMLSRSLFGLTRVYNHLPADVVYASSVKLFQSKLQNLMKEAATRERRNWDSMFGAASTASRRTTCFQRV